MQQLLIDRSADLKRLVDEGYEIEIQSGYLLLRNVPYVTEGRAIERGTLVSTLNLAGDTTVKPENHVAYFMGGLPCDHAGQPLSKIIIDQNRANLVEGLAVDCTFSSKPAAGYQNYYEKMNTYASILSHQAQMLDPTATARTFALFESQEYDSVFQYIDTASSRAQIGNLNEKLKVAAIAIVGLGGTGSYILDLIAKTPVKEIHLFDGDRLGQHNAFRSPGAASIEVLRGSPSKVDYFKSIYCQMRNGIFTHGYVDEETVRDLEKMDFVFIAIDQGRSRRLLVERLEALNIPFIDVGMGISDAGESLFGQLRTTLSVEGFREQAHHRLSLSGNDAANDYDRNIQIVELNAMNAALAVIRWKKFMGFYTDLGQEHTSLYQLDGNHLVNICEN